jgi:YD repeat-containing protein
MLRHCAHLSYLSLRRPALLHGVAIVIAISGSAPLASAQTGGPGVYADSHNPAGPPDPFKESQIWKVDPISGSVSIDIPFLSMRPSSRGPLYPYSLQYNSSATFELGSTIVPPSGISNPNPSQAFTWYTPNALNGAANPPAPWTEISSPKLFYNSTAVSITSSQGAPTTSCQLVGPFLLLDGKGSHDLNLTIVAGQSGPVAAPCSYGNVSTSNTNDGSTISTDWGQSPYAIYPDGTKLMSSGSPFALEDSNGNYLTTAGPGSSGTVSDSLGRSLYSVAEATSVNSSFIYPSTVTTYTTGTPASYSLMWGSEPFNFTFPEPTTSNIVSFGTSDAAIVYPGPGSGSIYVLQSLGLPDSTNYTFTYDPTYGVIQQITFPTGGHVRFVWGIRTIGETAAYAPQGISTLAVTDVYLSHGDTEDHWKYTCLPLNVATGALTCNVIDPEGNETDYTGNAFATNEDQLAWGGPSPFHETQRLMKSAGVLIRTVNTAYTNPVSTSGPSNTLPTSITTTLNDASGTPQQQQVKYTYDRYDNVIEKDESGWYPCASGVCTPPSWLRKTLSTYYWAQYPSYQTAHIVDKPYTISVTDGSGHLMAETQYTYDDFTVTGNTGIQNHDDNGYPAGFQGPRGNMTTEMHCVAFSGSSCAAWTKKTYTYDLTGQVTSATDPCGTSTCSDMNATNGAAHKTTYSYSDNFVDFSPSHPTNGYATTITRPSTGSTSHIDKYSFYYYAGARYQHTDENGQVTSYSYDSPGSGARDPFNRIGKITYPGTYDGPASTSASGYVSYLYSDEVNAFSVTQQSLMSTSNNQTLTKVTNYDSLGRLQNTQLTSDPSGMVETDTVYDSDGRIYSVSNPYRTMSDPTYGVTVYGYDGLNRKTSQTNPDKTAETWGYAGNIVTFKDELQNTWQRTYDGLSRLTMVKEPNGSSKSPSLETDYAYDALDNLLSVSQCGAACPASNSVVRSFTYDGLSRLTQSFNPETGWVCYGTTGGAAPNGSNCTSGYDANGNVGSKTDARNITIGYSYDSLNRMLSKRFSNDPGNTPSSCYQYDSSTLGVGRFASEWTQSASVGVCAATAPSSGLWSRRSIISYDAMGRILSEQQCTPSNCVNKTPYSPAYTFDLAGNQYTATNGVTSTPTVGTLSITSPFDSAGRLLSVNSNWNTDAAHPSTLFAAQSQSAQPCPQSLSAPYAAFGGLMNATYGGGVTLNRGYDIRLRTTCETDTGSVLKGGTNASATVTVTGTEQVK